MLLVASVNINTNNILSREWKHAYSTRKASVHPHYSGHMLNR